MHSDILNEHQYKPSKIGTTKFVLLKIPNLTKESLNNSSFSIIFCIANRLNWQIMQLTFFICYFKSYLKVIVNPLLSFMFVVF